MVFDIYDNYRGTPLVDIEIYSKRDEYTGKYFTTVDTRICSEGYAKFLLNHYDDFKDKQMLNLFLNDIDELLKLNFYLHEYWRREKDFPKDDFHASYYVDDKVRKEVKKFCEKWNLNINED